MTIGKALVEIEMIIWKIHLFSISATLRSGLQLPQQNSTISPFSIQCSGASARE